MRSDLERLKKLSKLPWKEAGARGGTVRFVVETPKGPIYLLVGQGFGGSQGRLEEFSNTRDFTVTYPGGAGARFFQTLRPAVRKAEYEARKCKWSPLWCLGQAGEGLDE